MKLKSRKLTEAVSAVLGSRTLSEAAEKIGVSLRTLERWQGDPAFQVLYAEESRHMLRHTAEHLRAASVRAIETLERNQDPAHAKPAVQVAAAKAVLDMQRQVDPVPQRAAATAPDSLSRLDQADGHRAATAQRAAVPCIRSAVAGRPKRPLTCNRVPRSRTPGNGL